MNKNILKLHTLFVISMLISFSFSEEINLPEIAGIDIKIGQTITLPTPTKVKTAFAFRFKDGRIVAGKNENTLWSFDNGRNWQHGPEMKVDEAIIDLGQSEILIIDRNSHKKSDDTFRVNQIRSSDNFQTTKKEEAELVIPNASFTVTGSGKRIDGFLFHHGILRLDNGQLIASMYGNFEGDTELCAGYPAELDQRKYHTIVVFSEDKGRTWGNPVHVAYDKMLGRGVPDNHAMIGKSIPVSMANRIAIVPAVTQEGFRESDLVQAKNGDLVCVMRSGGRNPLKGIPLFPTPLYCSRSEDNGLTWTTPMQIADRGVSPNVVTLSNGIIVCTYSRPGNWLIFSDDNGLTWKGAFQFGTGNATNYIIESDENEIQVFYETEVNDETKLVATFFTVKKTK